MGRAEQFGQRIADETRGWVGETKRPLRAAGRSAGECTTGLPYSGGPFRLRCLLDALRLGPPGGWGSGIVLIGRALRNSASRISGVVHRIGPQRANRCSRRESSLVNRSTIRGAGPSIEATTVSSRATSSATQRRPLGSVYLAANARRSDWSMVSRGEVGQQ